MNSRMNEILNSNPIQTIRIPEMFLDNHINIKKERKKIRFNKIKRMFLNKKFNNPHKSLGFRILSKNIKEGRWERSEHQKFISACLTYGNNWKKIEEEIKTRTAAQIRSHAQKFIIKLCKKYNIKLKSKRFCGSNLINFDRKKISPCQMTLEEKKLLDIFNYYNLEFYSDPFIIFQVHKNHKEIDCPFRKAKKSKIFAIEKMKTKESDISLQEGITSTLEELVTVNQRVIETLQSDYVNEELIRSLMAQMKTQKINLHLDFDLNKINLLEEYKKFESHNHLLNHYQSFIKTFYFKDREKKVINKFLVSKIDNYHQKETASKSILMTDSTIKNIK